MNDVKCHVDNITICIEYKTRQYHIRCVKFRDCFQDVQELHHVWFDSL